MQEPIGAESRTSIIDRDELINILAHDLRNPLFALKTMLSRMRRSQDTAVSLRDIDAASEAVARMEKLIGSILDCAILDGGQLAIESAIHPTEALIRESMRTLMPLFELKGVTFVHEACAASLVRADRERVLQALGNLLSNALKFSPPGNTVRVITEQCGNFVQFAIRDEGKGIARAHLPHVFERYWREEPRRSPGTGLGLYIAKAIVEAHGGTIWVESDTGCGATFYFTLPSASPEVIIVRPSATATLRDGSETVHASSTMSM